MDVRSQISGEGRARLLVYLLFLASFLAGAQGQISVSTALTRSSASVGEPIQLQLQINGGLQLTQPPNIAVDGLDIRYLGPFTLQQDINGVRTVTVTHTYQVIAQRPGVFTIPAIEVEAGGQRFRAAPLTLKVEPGNPAQPAGEQPLDKIAFAEIFLPKTTAYVGQALQAEIRLYIDARVNAQLEQMPLLPGDGFTKTKLTEPRTEAVQRDGREYKVVIFRTAITPSKAGKIGIGPSDFSFIAQVPRAQRRRAQTGMDLFDDFFNNGGFGVQQQRMTAQAPAVELEVKPLPAKGRPADFSGAVGEFSFEANGSPALVKVGDPVTMRLRITGEGNFDRVSAPVMVDTEGWRAYPASPGAFQTGDDWGTRGMKTFEMPVIPEKPQTAMPKFHFSYFDPKAEKYVTLQSDTVPLVVEGGPPPPPPKVTTADVAPAPEENALPSQPTDIFGLHYEFGKVRQTFEPLCLRREFLLAQFVPAALLLIVIGRRLFRRSDEERRVADLRQEKGELLRKLRTESAHAEFFDMAARVIQLETALRTGRRPGSVDAATACDSRRLAAETADAVADIFNARAELLYAGGGGGDGGISPAARDLALATIKNFSSANGST